ncbi:MAG: hypothetical protein WA131_10385 [Desulfitobacteriaceae bacterium]
MKNNSILLFLGPVLVFSVIITGCAKPATTELEPVKEFGLVAQFKASGHYTSFPTMLAKSPATLKAENYEDSCLSCHSAVKIIDDKNAKLADFFAGGKYAGKGEGITCRVCHVFEGKDMFNLKNQGWETCAVCHTSGGTPILGNEVHHPQSEFIKGIGVGDVPNIPSYKYANFKDDFTCQDCHVTNGQKHDFMIPGVTTTHKGLTRTSSLMNYEQLTQLFKQDRCIGCHNPTSFVDKISQQQIEIENHLEKLKKIYDEWTIRVQTLDKNDPKVKAFQEGSTYYTYVQADGSKGIHNYTFAKALIAQAYAKYTELDPNLGRL